MNTIRVDYKTVINLMSDNKIIEEFVFNKFMLIIKKDGRKDHVPFLIDVSKGTKVFTFAIPYFYHGKSKYLPVKVDGDKPMTYVSKYVGEYISYVGDEYRAKELTYIFRDVIRSLTYHIMNYQRNRKEVHPVPRKYSREHRISTSNNKIYLFDDIIKYVHDNYVPQGGQHEIKCPCWEVRGHYRHYKSGKIIFIPAYKKGKERNKVAPKDKEYYV